MANKVIDHHKGSDIPRRRISWQVLALAMLICLLTACSGGSQTVGPDYGTAAPETPGPITPQEQQYIHNAKDYIGQLAPAVPKGGSPIVVDPFDESLIGSRNPQLTPLPEWQSRGQSVLVALEASWSRAVVLPASLRLQAINEHYQSLLAYYRKVLDKHQQEIAPGHSFPSSEPGEWRYVKAERERFYTLIDGFQQRHP